MSDRVVVATAVAILAGAWFRPGVPIALVVAVGTVALLTAPRWPLAFVVAGALMASTLADRAWGGLDTPLARGATVSGIATLVADPVRVPGGVRVDLRVDGRRYRATAGGDHFAVVMDAAAGERFHVRGRYRPFDPDTRARLAARHLVGRVAIGELRAVDSGSPIWRVANGTRALLLRGASSFPADRRALFAGIVLGDDREQDPAEVEDFRASGLTHLLAVSGQNVAFALALVAPAFRRLGLQGRFVGGVAVLALFGSVTRWEPSVARAVAMALVALLATTLGRQVSPLRLLAIAAGALVLVDPLLVHSVGFALSVAACAGIAVFAPRLRARMPDALAVTLSAQLAVVPILLPTFGSMPLGAVPANLLAAPVAGPLMMWGVAAGLVAGVVGGPMATLVHLPTLVMLEWLAGVARVTAGLPLGWVTPRMVVIGALASVAGLAVLWIASRTHRWLVVVAAITCPCIVVPAVVSAVHPPAARGVLLDTGGSDRLWRAGGVTVVVSDGRAPPGRLLAQLRKRGVARANAIVVTRSSSAAARSFAPVAARIPSAVVLAPPNHQIAGAIAIETMVDLQAGPFTLHLRPQLGAAGVRGSSRLTVRIASAG